MMKDLLGYLCASLLALGMLTLQVSAASTQPVLKSGTDTYANVTVVSQTPTHLFIQHSRGVANIKIEDLDLASLRALGIALPADVELEVLENTVATGEMTLSTTASGMQFAIPAVVQKHLPEGMTLTGVSRSALRTVVAAIGLVYLLFCYCALQICKKTGHEPGLWIWLPVLQLLPLIRAAGMSRWWFLAWFVPGVNFLVQIWWCLKIAQARGKSVLTGIMLIFPVTGLFAFLYLAFSDSPVDQDGGGKPLVLEPLPA